MPTLNPFKEALQKLAGRSPVGVDFSSSEWADVPLELRERALFSARTTNAAYLQDIKDRVEAILNPVTVERDGQPVTQGLDVATARTELKQILKSISYDPGDKAGTIEDLSSDARLNLVLRHNVQSSQGYGNYLQSQAEGVLDEWPAQELFRAESREEPRDWPTRWMQAGGQIFAGRMIALKSDPIWSEISRFGTPYAPLDYNSGMELRDVDRETAIELGLLQPGATVQRTVEEFNARLTASAADLSPELLDSLQQSFGDQVEIGDGVIRWKGGEGD